MGVRARWLGAAGLALALVGVLAACTGSGQDSGASAGAGAAASAPDRAALEPSAGASAAPPNAAAKDSAADTASITLRPALIRTAELTVVVHDVPAEAAAAGTAARACLL
jgi:hypothetical protein